MVSQAQYEADKQKWQNVGRKLKGAFKKVAQDRRETRAYIDDLFEQAHEQLRSMHGRQNRYADSFTETHTEASAYRDQMGMLINALAIPLRSIMTNANREDASNVYLLTAADVVRGITGMTNLPEISGLVELVALALEAAAHYDPVTGFSSIFMQNSSVVRVPYGTPTPAGVATAGVTFG